MENHSATSATTLNYNKGKRIRCGKKGKVGGGCIVIEKVKKVGCEDSANACVENIVKEICHGKANCTLTASHSVLKTNLKCGKKETSDTLQVNQLNLLSCCQWIHLSTIVVVRKSQKVLFQ